MKKSKDFKYAVIVFVACLALMLVSMMACNVNGFDIFHDEDIIIHTDTIPDPIVLDTCQSYQDITDLKWCSFALNLDGVPMPTYQFYLQTNGHFKPIDLDSFLMPYESHIYFSGINVCGIVNGLDAPSWGLNHGIYMADAFGSFYLITFNPYLYVFNGTLTYDQFYDNIVTHSNFKRLGFWNTGNFTCDQVNTILDYLIDNCIDGTGNIIDLRNATCQDQGRIGLLELAGFTVITQ